MSDHSQNESSSGPSSDTKELIKTVQQLIDSDDDQIISNKLVALQATFPILKVINPLLTNQEKLVLFLRDHHFRNRIAQAVPQNDALVADPVVKIQLFSIRHRHQVAQQFAYEDLLSVASKFGKVISLQIQACQAFLRYDSYVSCYMLIKTLNGMEVSDILRLSAIWCDKKSIPRQELQIAHPVAFDGQIVPDFKKFMGRFDIYLDSTKDFNIAKRIIGPKGNNMKKILDDVKSKKKQLTGAVDSIAKIRLRGKGSGFLQGVQQTQSDQMLNLCISSKDWQGFSEVCEGVQKLLVKISQEYKEYLNKNYPKVTQGIAFRRYELKQNEFVMIKQLNLEQITKSSLSCPLQFIQPRKQAKGKMPEHEINRLIGLRDKARKQGRFDQADQIRVQLRQQGVVIVDQKNANGRALKTTWKYLDL